MGWKYSRGSSEQQLHAKKKKDKLENTLKRTNDNKPKLTNNIQTVTKKIRRTTSVLPLVLASKEAYKDGQDKCQTCGIQKEEYKQIMQNVKVIEILIDGVIEREQANLLSNEFGSDEENPNQENGLKGYPRNSTKLTCKLDIYGREIIIKHSLKCILIKLQKTIGDILVQIGFVKTRGLAKEDRYKAFDLSLDELKQLKFEFTSLTDKIIQLFKKPPDKTSNGEVCIFCVKEKLTKYNEILLEMLKRGRNLKVVMRNEQLETMDQCCQRNYPHVHAQVHGKPLVLKYSLPYQIQDNTAGPSIVQNQGKPANRPYENEQYRHPSLNSEELGKNYQNAMTPNVFQRPGAIPSSTIKEEFGGIHRIPEKPLYMKEDSPTHLESIYVEPLAHKTDSKNGGNSYVKKQSNQSLISGGTLKSVHNIDKPGQVRDSLREDEESSQKQQNDERNSYVQDPIDRKIISRSSDCGSDSSNIRESVQEDVGRNVSHLASRSSRSSKKVSFYNEPQQTFLPLAVCPSKTAFNHSNRDYSPNITIPENDLGMNKTPFGDKINNIASYPAAVDSFILTKQRQTSIKSENNVVDFFEDKPIACAYKSFVSPEYKTSKTLTCVSVKEKINQPHLKNISHQDKKIEHLLKLLGNEKLLSVTTPAECCDMKNILTEYGSSTNVPHSASLYSLPLEHSDLRYLAQVAGKHISNENLWQEPDKVVPVKEYEWEVQADSSPDQTKWQRAFAGTEKQSEHSLNLEETPHIKRTRAKSVLSREDLKVLPTIDEEDIIVDGTVSSMPYVPSIPSLPLSDEEKNSLSIHRMETSGKKYKTMELRYFTVEFENKTINSKSLEQKYKSSKLIKPTSGDISDDSDVKTDNDVDLIVSQHYLKYEKKKQSNIESFYPCKTGIVNKNSLNIKEDNKHSALDEMIMMNAIYLGSNNIATANSLQSSRIKPTEFPYSSCSQYLKNNYPCIVEKNSKIEAEGSNATICSNNCTHLLNSQKMIPNTSQNIRKNNKSESAFNMRSHKQALTCQNNFKEHRCCDKKENKYDNLSNEGNLKDRDKNINRENVVNFKKESAKTLQDSNATTRDEKHTPTGQGHLCTNFPLDKFNTFYQNNEMSYSNYLSNHTKHFSLLNSNDEPLYNKLPEKIFKNDCSKKYECRPKFTINRGGYWSKLNNQTKNIKKPTRNKRPQKSDHWVKKHKELKRKPFIPEQSCLKYRRMEGKANMPPLRFTQLRPVLARERISSVVYSTKNTFLEMYSNCQDEANLVNTSFQTIPKISREDINMEKSASHKLEFGFEKEYISVKNNHIYPHTYRDLQKTPITLLNYEIPKPNLCKLNMDNCNLKVQTELNQTNAFAKQIPQNITKAYSQQSFVLNSSGIDSFKENKKCPFYLYDVDGLPLTDNSGRPLRNLQGDLLMICNDAGIPISDANSRPIYDALGNSLYSAEFAPKKPSCADILRSLTNSSGDPLLLYNVEGRPLTSLSGTILVDSLGNCLIKFGSNGNPVSDTKGRPMFDFQGKPVMQSNQAAV